MAGSWPRSDTSLSADADRPGHRDARSDRRRRERRPVFSCHRPRRLGSCLHTRGSCDDVLRSSNHIGNAALREESHGRRRRSGPLAEIASWALDGSALIVTADDNGRCPMWRIEVGTGDVARVTSDDLPIAMSPQRRMVRSTHCAARSRSHRTRCAWIQMEPLPCSVSRSTHSARVADGAHCPDHRRRPGAFLAGAAGH